RAVGGRERDPLPVATDPAQGDGDRRPVLDDRVRRPLTGQAGEGDGPHRDGRVVTAALDQRHADRGASLYEGLSGGRYAVRGQSQAVVDLRVRRIELRLQVGRYDRVRDRVDQFVPLRRVDHRRGRVRDDVVGRGRFGAPRGVW